MQGDKIQWAFLPKFREESDNCLLKVWTNDVASPSVIFVSRDDFIDKLENLDKELGAHITSSIQEVYPNYNSIFSNYYEVQMVVAVREPIDQK